MTVLEAITDASVMAGIAALGEVLEAEDSAYGMSRLNDMIDIWSVDRLAIPKRDRVGSFTLTPGTSSYSVGTGATWDIPRPSWIDAVGLIDILPGDDVELPMTPLTLKEWSRVRVKAIQSPLPRRYFYDKTYPSGTIYIYPLPNEANQVVLYVPVAVAEFTSLDQTIAVPPGYRMTIISNLAVLLAMGVEEIDPAVAALASGSYAAIKASNVVDHMDPMTCDPGLLTRDGGSFNFLTGNVE